MAIARQRQRVVDGLMLMMVIRCCVAATSNETVFGASTAAIDFRNMKWLWCVLNIADYMVDERRCSLMELIRAQQSNYENFERIKWFQEN